MKMNTMKSIATGALMGVAAGVIMSPKLDRSTKRKIRKSGKVLRDTAEDMYDNVRGWMR